MAYSGWFGIDGFMTTDDQAKPSILPMTFGEKENMAHSLKIMRIIFAIRH